MQNLEARRKPLRHMPWHREVAEILVPVSPATGPADMETWLLARIAEELKADPLGIDPMLPPSVYGFAAGQARALTRELERCLGRKLGENVFGADLSVRAMARRLCTDTNPRVVPPPTTRDEMRRQVLARAARRPRRPLVADPGEEPQCGSAGCSPGERTHAEHPDLALAG